MVPPAKPRFALRWHSMRAQLMAWNIVTLAVMLGILGVFIQYTVRATMMASVDRELDRAARRFMHPIGEPNDGPPGGPMPQDGRPDQGGLPDFGLGPGLGMRGGPSPEMGAGPGPDGPLMEPASQVGGVRLRPRMIDTLGNVIEPPGETQPWDGGAFSTAVTGTRVYSTVRIDDDPVRIISQPLPPRGTVAQVIQIPLPLADVERAAAGVNRALLTLIPVALLWAGLGEALLTGRALRPVRRLTQTAGRISARDLSERLPVFGEDEFAELSVTFNAMLQRLEASFEEQRRLVDELKRLVERERRFTADASHELRTPLTIIKANTSLALGESTAPDHVRQSFEDIDRAADTASRLVQDLLLLARSDAGQLGSHPITLPIADILARTSSAFAHSAGAPIHVNVPDAALCVAGNEDELVKLFTNLLDNARRYTPADGSITFSAQREGDEVRIQVSDTGSGIAAEHLPHLGERFYRVDPSRTRRDGGAGLGLSICRGIAEAHGGSLSIESTEGQWTTVSVSLPAAQE